MVIIYNQCLETINFFLLRKMSYFIVDPIQIGGVRTVLFFFFCQQTMQREKYCRSVVTSDSIDRPQ